MVDMRVVTGTDQYDLMFRLHEERELDGRIAYFLYEYDEAVAFSVAVMPNPRVGTKRVFSVWFRGVFAAMGTNPKKLFKQ